MLLDCDGLAGQRDAHLSILSQLLLCPQREGCTGTESFQFFPSCFVSTRVHQIPQIPYLFQFFPSCFKAYAGTVTTITGSTLFQFFPSCFLEGIADIPTLMGRDSLSILSQLLPLTVGSRSHSCGFRAFNSFPVASVQIRFPWSHIVL